MSDAVELLTLDDQGRAIPGPMFPRDRGVVVWLSENDTAHRSQRLAYPHKFFKRDKHGQPLPDTLVTFLVPDYMCRGGSPSYVALAAVSERMGWDRNEP